MQKFRIWENKVRAISSQQNKDIFFAKKYPFKKDILFKKQNIPKNQSWVEETIKSLGKENQELKIKEIHAGYRLYIKIEQVIGDQKRRFMDHIDLKLSAPKKTLKKNLNAFLKRNQLEKKRTNP